MNINKAFYILCLTSSLSRHGFLERRFDISERRELFVWVIDNIMRMDGCFLVLPCRVITYYEKAVLNFAEVLYEKSQLFYF